MRLPANYRNLDLEFLDSDDLDSIEIKAKTLAFEDCLDILAVTEEDIPPGDMSIARRVWRKGRATGIAEAGQTLFSSMDKRNGGAIAFEYLRALSPTFQLEVANPHGSPGSGFSFNVIMPDDKQAPPLSPVED